jgi:hypothetical protein
MTSINIAIHDPFIDWLPLMHLIRINLILLLIL